MAVYPFESRRCSHLGWVRKFHQKFQTISYPNLYSSFRLDNFPFRSKGYPFQKYSSAFPIGSFIPVFELVSFISLLSTLETFILDFLLHFALSADV